MHTLPLLAAFPSPCQAFCQLQCGFHMGGANQFWRVTTGRSTALLVSNLSLIVHFHAILSLPKFGIKLQHSRSAPLLPPSHPHGKHLYHEYTTISKICPLAMNSRISPKKGVGVLLRVVIFLAKNTPTSHPCHFCHALSYAIMSAFIC